MYFRMHVAIIDGDVSYPATSGKRLRTLNLMLQVAKRHRITYVGRCAADSEEARVAPAFLRERGIEPILVPHPVARKSGPAFAARLAANLFSAHPYSVTSHQSEPMRRAITELASDKSVDVWQLEWSAYLPMIDAKITGPRVLIAHNVDTLIWQRYYDTERNFLKPNVDVVDNGIDRAFFESVTGQRDPARILFLGALDWRPNLDAVGLLLDKIFPRVRRQEPSATLAIVGRHPPASLIERARQTPGVELLADVPDVRPYLGASGVMAVPLRIGGGSRLKIIEALACGLPVVSTRVGAEGLLLAPGVDYVQAEEDAMADALVGAIRKPDEMQTLAQHGRRIVLDTYDWSVLAHKLERAWEKSLCASST
jgi:polysaccharide biosynthesis protein PslH